MRKMGRMDKIKAKEKIKDYPKKNPIISALRNLDLITRKNLMNNFKELMLKKPKY